MDTKKLEALITVIKHGSLTSASEELGYTQPGLTNMMNSIEDELGIVILNRGKTGVRLSAAGQELFPSIRSLLQAVNTFNSDVDRVRHKNYSYLKVGAFSSITRQWLPSIMRDFVSSVPDIDLSASMQDIKTLYDAVRGGTLDCAIVSYAPDMLHGLAWVPLAEDEFVAVLPKEDNPGGDSFPIEKFEGKHFLMPSGGFDIDIIPMFDSSITPGSIQYTNLDDATIVSLVEHGLGSTIMSRLIMKGIASDTVSLPLDPPGSRKLGVIYNSKKKNDRSVAAFIESAKKTIARLQEKENKSSEPAT